MKQKDKELLLKDLCERFPYGVICSGICNDFDVNKDEYVNKRVVGPVTQITINYVTVGITKECEIDTVKPYLRPMSSMTVEEAEKLEQIAIKTLGDFMFEAEEDGGAIYHFSKWKTISPEMFDYLNSIYIDYRGLIPMGLALPATEGMYND